MSLLVVSVKGKNITTSALLRDIWGRDPFPTTNQVFTVRLWALNTQPLQNRHGPALGCSAALSRSRKVLRSVSS